MRILIDIPDTQYNNIMEVKSMSLGRIPYKGIIMNAIRGIQNGTPIPDNATNGDVIMAMFPNVNVYEHNGGATYSVNNEYNFNATWWNSPYQKGGKE